MELSICLCVFVRKKRLHIQLTSGGLNMVFGLKQIIWKYHHLPESEPKATDVSCLKVYLFGLSPRYYCYTPLSVKTVCCIQCRELATLQSGEQTFRKVFSSRAESKRVCVSNVVTYLKVVFLVYSGPSDAPEHDALYMHCCNNRVIHNYDSVSPVSLAEHD